MSIKRKTTFKTLAIFNPATYHISLWFLAIIPGKSNAFSVIFRRERFDTDCQTCSNIWKKYCWNGSNHMVSVGGEMISVAALRLSFGNVLNTCEKWVEYSSYSDDASPEVELFPETITMFSSTSHSVTKLDEIVFSYERKYFADVKITVTFIPKKYRLTSHVLQKY